MTRASDTAKLLGAGATILDGTTISTADNTVQLTLTSTDADANVGPQLILDRNSSSPADNDRVGEITFSGRNDADETTEFAVIQSRIIDASNGTEDGRLILQNMIAGSVLGVMENNSTETVFNQDSVDIDFRVESDANANAFFLEASTGRIGMGTNAMGDYHANNDDLVISTSGSTGITIVSGTSDQGRIAFADGTGSDDEVRGLIMYNHNGNAMTFNTNAGTAMYILSTGNVGIGTDQNAHGLTIYRHLHQYGGIMIQNGTNNTGNVFQAFHNYNGDRIGSISQNNNAVVYNTSSDYRLKENVSYTFDATSRLKQLKPARFNWISDDTNTTIDGFLAHEVSDIVPEAITGKKDGTQDLGTVKDADGNVIETNLSETFFTERKKETVDKDGNTEAVIYPSDYTWTKTGTENVYQGIDQSKIVPLLTKTILELEARITALESA